MISRTETSPEAAVESLQRSGLTDGLPVIAPTADRVAAAVAATGLDADHVVALVPPMFGEATVEVLAANAIMAGCRPELMPVVVAAVRAMCRPEFNLFGVRTSNHPASPLFVVAGPVAAELGFNWGTNVFGPGSAANATVGRACNLVIANVGGAVPGLVDQSVMGHPGRYTYCIAEDPQSPWAPLHTETGMAADASSITCFAGDAPVAVIDYSSTEPGDLVEAFAFAVANVWRNPFYALSEVLVVANIAHARVLTRSGWQRPEILSAIASRARAQMGETDTSPEAQLSRASLHLACAGGRWGQYSAIVNGWVGPGFGSTMTSEEVVACP
jgi:hypothetical protein